MKVFAWKKKGTSLLKTGFLVTLNLKEKQKIDELKLFEENWNFGNYLKIEILKKYLKIGVLKIKFKD